MTTSLPKVKWGVLGVAKIATTKVIPAMQRSAWSTVAAIASRDHAKAQQAARALGITRTYGSYDELLADPEIEAIYNPLPNHLHVPWTLRAIEAGKHVLCEKPIAMSAAEAETLIASRDRARVHVQEAFMVRTHPQWLRVRDIVRSGRIGALKSLSGFFSYFNADPQNVRNIRSYGGGALMDIGCYLIHTGRFVFEREPSRVIAAMDRDPTFTTDVLTSILLDFAPGHVVGTCGTQLVPYQRIGIFGDRGRIDIEIPFNAPPDRPTRVFVDDGSDLFGAGCEEIALDACDQYTIQGDLFSKAVRGAADPVYRLEDSVRNMHVIDALFRSAESQTWERPS